MPNRARTTTGNLTESIRFPPPRGRTHGHDHPSGLLLSCGGLTDCVHLCASKVDAFSYLIWICVVAQLHHELGAVQYAGPGHWNDPDMLEIGTGNSTTLAAAASLGDTTIKVASVSGAVAGAAIRIGTTANGDLEGGIIASVGTAGATGTGITLADPITLAHPTGEGVGKSGLTLTEARTEQTLWAEEAAPLIAGTNLIDIAPQNLAVYNNHEIAGIDQDSLGVQAAGGIQRKWTVGLEQAVG